MSASGKRESYVDHKIFKIVKLQTNRCQTHPLDNQIITTTPFPLLKKSRYVHVKVFNRFTCAIMRFTFFLQKRRNTKINHIFKSKDDIMQLSFVIMLISFYYRLENLSHGTTSSLWVRVNYISRVSLITEVDFCSNYLY